MRVRHILPAAAILACAACGNTSAKNIRLDTPAFSYGSDIPMTYTCRADNQSPPFAWDLLPKGTKSLTFIVEDLTAHKTQWLVYDISPTSTGSPEQGVATDGIQGTNDDGKTYYIGPCGPKGQVHRYSYKVIALDTKLGLPAGAKRAQVDQAMKGHQLGFGEIQANDAGM